MTDILAIGELLIDLTPIKTDKGSAFLPNPGGAPCNMLAMAQSMGASTAFIGKVGNDQFGHRLKETLNGANINTQGLIMSDDYNTTLAFVHLSDEGDRSFSFYRKGCADTMLFEHDIDYTLVDQCKLLHFGSLSFTDEPSKETLLKVLSYAKSKNIKISYDPNYRPALWSRKEVAIKNMMLGFDYADYIKVSDEEALLLTNKDTIEAAADDLFNKDISLVTVTLGDQGVYYKHACGSGYVKAFKSDVIDTTGAGDSFFGALMAQIVLADNKNISQEILEDYLKNSNAAASIVVEGFGGIPSIPDKVKVLERAK